MSRYIEANEIRKRLFSYYDCVNESTAKGNYRGETLMTYEVAQMIENCIEETPTADVQKMKHSHWIEENARPCSTKWICAVCHKISYTAQHCRNKGLPKQCVLNYCPHCGAKMDGGDA